MCIRDRPINIASINSKDESPSGNIKGLSITNVRCKGEGSIYIAGKDSAPIEDLTLNNIRLELEKTTKYPIKGYDFRPCCGPDFQEGKINGIYVKNAKNVKAENLEVTVHDNICLLYTSQSGEGKNRPSLTSDTTDTAVSYTHLFFWNITRYSNNAQGFFD